MKIQIAHDEQLHVLRKAVSLLGGVVLGLLIVFCYFASSLCITVVLATFLSILVDPLITALEKWVPRALSSSLLIIAGAILLGGPP